ncbi:tetratricopeptide repeat protein, partial [Spirochaetota bacterium]
LEIRAKRLEEERKKEEKKRMIEDIITEVKLFIENKKYENALVEIEKAFIIDPEHGEALFLKKEVRSLVEERNRSKKADMLYRKAMDAFNENRYAEAISILKDIFIVKAEHLKGRSLEAKINAVLKEMEKQERIRAFIMHYLSAGKKLMTDGKYEEALLEFEKILQMDAEHEEARSLSMEVQKNIEEIKREQELVYIQEMLEKGIVSYTLKEYEEAISYLQECLRLSPNNKYAQEYLKLAGAAYRLKREEEIDATSPYYPLINNYKIDGLAYFNAKKYDESVEIWKKILLLFPKNKLALQYIFKSYKYANPSFYKDILEDKMKEGKTLLESKRNLEALSIFELVKESSPEHPGIKELITQAKGIKEKPDSLVIKAKYSEALKHYNDQEYDKASGIWNEIIAMDNTEIQAKLYISKVENMLNYNEIKTQRSQASENNTRHGKTHFSKGMSYYNQGKYKEAIREWENVLSYIPDDKRSIVNIRRTKQLIAFE